MYHLVYLTTNLINSKIYVGVHSTYNLEDGYIGSGFALKRAIKKYGKNNFKRQILHYCLDRDQANTIEMNIITLRFISTHNTYNLVLGGGSGDITFRSGKTYEEIYGTELSIILRNKRSVESTGRIKSEETKNKIRNGNIGKIISDETKQRMRTPKLNTENMGRYERTIETKQKISKSHTTREICICEHCHKSMNRLNYVKWHGDKCKLSPCHVGQSSYPCI